MSQQSLRLLLSILNSPRQMVAGHSLFSDYPLLAQELISNDYLMPAEPLTSVTQGGQQYRLNWCQRAGYRYFNNEVGWSAVCERRIERYRVTMAKVLSLLQAMTEIKSHPITCIEPSMLWHLGYSRWHASRVHWYFARRLHASESALSVEQHLKAERYRVPAVILSASVVSPIIELPLNQRVIPLEKLLSRDGTCRLDELSLQSLLNHKPTVLNRSGGMNLQFSSDFRRVDWQGQSYVLTKKQAAVVESLFESGGRAHKDYLCAQANTSQSLQHIMRNRVNGQWVAHPLMGTLIHREGNGYYCLNH